VKFVYHPSGRGQRFPDAPVDNARYVVGDVAQSDAVILIGLRCMLFDKSVRESLQKTIRFVGFPGGV
jgi:hypothetical protein